MRTTRLKKRMTLRDLSVETGIDASRLSELETGRAEPKGFEVDGIAMALGSGIKFADSESARKKQEELTAMMDGMGKVLERVKEIGLKKGNGGTGSMPCPICKNTLYFSCAAINGHVWGNCRTNGCLKWMQ